MLETWCPSDIILFFVLMLSLGAPVVYAWADRWLDRTRNKISDIVKSDDED